MIEQPIASAAAPKVVNKATFDAVSASDPPKLATSAGSRGKTNMS